MYHEAIEKVSKQVLIRDRYDNFIGGKWVAPSEGRYFDNPSPVTGKKLCAVPRSTAADIELALDAAHKAKDAWGKTSVAERSRHPEQDRRQARSQPRSPGSDRNSRQRQADPRDHLCRHAAGGRPLALFPASVIRAQEGGISEVDAETVAYHFHEPLGVVGQIIPWNFPILMATWKLAPALAAGNCVVIKPAEQTPLGILVVMELIADLLPPGVINVVNGFGVEVGKPLAQNKRIAKIAFTGETTTGRQIMQYASENLIPVTLELGGKSPNIFFADVAEADDEFFDKALEGFAMFALNQGEVCTCPSRVRGLIQESIYDRFMRTGAGGGPRRSSRAIRSIPRP